MVTDNRTIRASAEPVDDGFGPEAPAMELLASGKNLMKAGTPFMTAISVQKPRSLDKIVASVLTEAEMAGEEFYYSWKQGGELIEGPTIGLANSLAREWGNCAVTVELQENDEAFYLTPRFIDLEKGFQTERVFRQRKGAVQGKYDPDRKLDIALQIGQSKAIRNVVVNAVPRWLVAKAVEKAKEAVVKGIDATKLDEWRNIMVHEFKAFRITAEQLVDKLGKPVAEWGTRDIATLKGDIRVLKTGEMTPAELFPPKDPAKTTDGPITGQGLADALPKTGTDTPAAEDPVAARQRELDKAKAAQQGAPSTEEQERIKKKELFDSYAMVCAKCPPMTFGTNDTEDMKRHMAEKHPNGKAETKPSAPPTKGGDLFGPKK